MIRFEEMHSPKTFLPGIRAKYVIITPTCRKNRGDAGAVDEALRQIRGELEKILLSWPNDVGATFHVVATVDRRGRGASWEE